jgi:hypothetical protein
MLVSVVKKIQMRGEKATKINRDDIVIPASGGGPSKADSLKFRLLPPPSHWTFAQ